MEIQACFIQKAIISLIIAISRKIMFLRLKSLEFGFNSQNKQNPKLVRFLNCFESLPLFLSNCFQYFHVKQSWQCHTAYRVTAQNCIGCMFIRVLMLSFTNLVELREDWFCWCVSLSQEGIYWPTSLAKGDKNKNIYRFTLPWYSILNMLVTP